MALKPISSMHRKSGMLVVEPVYAARFLNWAHKSPLGIWMMQSVLSRCFVSWLYGWWHRRSWTKYKILPFVDAVAIDLDICQKKVSEFSSFAEFFARKIDLTKRPIAHEPGVCVSPVDSRVLAYEFVSATRAFEIKGRNFDLRSFLRLEEDMKLVESGPMLVFRLHLADYHHFHFPVSCRPSRSREIAGRSYMVSPYITQWLPKTYSENRRTITRLESDEFGPLLMIEIGGFTISSLVQEFEPEVKVGKGDHKGHFGLGGSTVVLVFQPGRAKLDADILRNTAEGFETIVNFGEQVAMLA